MTIIGFRKIWRNHYETAFDYNVLINSAESGVNPQTQQYHGLQLHWDSLMLQTLNCVMICAISLQSEIFSSWGYRKYVTQAGGSMDLIVQLADLKAKSIAFTFNNLKIRKIISI